MQLGYLQCLWALHSLTLWRTCWDTHYGKDWQLSVLNVLREWMISLKDTANCWSRLTLIHHLTVFVNHILAAPFNSFTHMQAVIWFFAHCFYDLSIFIKYIRTVYIVIYYTSKVLQQSSLIFFIYLIRYSNSSSPMNSLKKYKGSVELPEGWKKM